MATTIPSFSTNTYARLPGFRGINSVETNTFTRYFYRVTVNYSRQPRNIGQ